MEKMLRRNKEDTMNRLLAFLDDIDKLHSNAGMDIRHRERFLRRLEHDWPHLSAKVRQCINATSRPPDLPGVVTYLGTFEHLDRLGCAVFSDFNRSNREGVFLHLSRNRHARTTQDDYRLTVGFTGDDAIAPATDDRG